ncbi:hypothetical protein BaRGS_00024982, partial [Batillaria attramentaria]
SCLPVKDDMLNVHLVPHTHDDVGWLLTVDQYYYKEVQYILDSVIPELQRDPTRRFTYVEMAFFARWFRQQDDAMKKDVKQLVNEGRLDFTLGGWCMNDEATTLYSAIIDQHALGFDFLRQNFGHCGRPRIGWQIDPFGHSREQASLFAQFGFDSLFFGRLDYQDKLNRMKTKTMEMIWRGSPNNLGTKADIFTGVLPNGYNPPKGFCFDMTWYCEDEPIKDDPRLHDMNVKEKVDSFLQAVREEAKHYNTNHVIVTMGTDFLYHAAHMWYKNMDKLIKYVNERQANGSDVNLLYSTPACYTYHVNKAGKTWPTKEDDFFPYASRAHGFWTGYFTSRSSFKLYARRVNSFFQIIKQLDALAMLENSVEDIRILAEAVGVVQHHDAITGTEKQVVAYDYAERLSNGVHRGQTVLNNAFKKLLPLGTVTAPELRLCQLLNISTCNLTETAGQDSPVYTVTGPNGTSVQSELLPIVDDSVRIPERSGATAQRELVFPVILPPLGYNVYFITATEPGVGRPAAVTSKGFMGEDVTIAGKYLSLTFDGHSGLLKSMTNLEHNLTVPVSQTFLYYVGFPGNNTNDDLMASGAYLFRPKSAEGLNLTRPNLSTRCLQVKGDLIQEVSQRFNPWVTQLVRVYQDQRFAEFQWTVGPIPVDDGEGKEIISRFTTGLKNQQIFYTDANGREMIKRRLNHRDTWRLNQTEPVSGNYYPVNSRIYIRDETQQIQFTVLTDRSQGGSSLHEGHVELMVHRRLLYDDSLGVGEPLNETGSDGKGLVVRGSHYVTLEPVAKAASVHRELGQRLFMTPQVALTTLNTSRANWSSHFNTTWSGLKKRLPPNVLLLTLEQFPVDGPASAVTQPFLLRLEHFYEKGEDPKLSQPTTVSLQDLFSSFRIVSATELTLGANLPLSQLQRLKWKSDNGSETDNVLRSADGLTVTLHPMEIRTFQITTDPALKLRGPAPPSGGKRAQVTWAPVLLMTAIALLVQQFV